MKYVFLLLLATAVTFYTILFKKDPTDIKFNYSLDSDTASKIRKADKKVAFNRLKEWYRYDKTIL